MKMKILLLSMVLISGCARSRNYQDEQSYYRSDSSANKSASVAKVEKMGQPKKKMIVLPFMNDTPFGDQELGTAASDELMRLLRGGRKVVVPEDLKTSEVSKDYYTGDKVRLSPLVRLGKQLGVSLVIVGKIKKVRYRQKGDEVGLFRQKRALAAVDVEVRLFDCFEGRSIFFDAKTADSSSAK